MNDILFGNNNSKVITKLSKRYFKKNKVRNLAALLAIILTAFLFTSITSLAFNMASSIQLSLQMQKGSKADGTLGQCPCSPSWHSGLARSSWCR